MVGAVCSQSEQNTGRYNGIGDGELKVEIVAGLIYGSRR